MVHNRNKLISLLIGNLANAVIHKILEQAVQEENLRQHYDKEKLTSLTLAIKYREEINPVNAPLPEADVSMIAAQTSKKVDAELKKRIARGYDSLNLGLVEPAVNQMLKGLVIKGDD
ncbi:hypothetical protein HYU14_03350 [Candidatus Woesearchaeota archaeon]|nr:hypothetical protein [Candidatus Woesearchaeota archaeon]